MSRRTADAKTGNAMFRSFADVVMPEDLRLYVKVPAIATGRRQIVTAKPTGAFKRYQLQLDARTRYEPGGTGLATSVLHDESGVVGTGAQTLLVSRLAGSS